MNLSGKNYYPFLLLLAILLVLFNYGALAIVLKRTMPDVVFVFHGFFLGLTLLVHVILGKSNKSRPQQFIAGFLGTLSLKMLLSMFALLGYVYFNRDNMILISFNFFAIYISYTIFETMVLLNKQN